MDFDFDKVAAQNDSILGKVAAQAAQVQLAAERFDFDKVAAQVAQAQLAADSILGKVAAQNDSILGKVAAQAAQVQLAAERFDLGKVAAQAAQVQLAAERFDLGKVAAQAAQAQLAASSFLAAMPELTPELFGGAWNERVAASVWRLERTSLTEDIVADAADPKRAVEELAKDAAAVEEAAPPGAKERVNTRLYWLWVQRLSQLVQLAKFAPLVFDMLMKLLDLDYMTLLSVNAEDLPTVPPPDLPTTQQIKPVPSHLEEDPSIKRRPIARAAHTPRGVALVRFIPPGRGEKPRRLGAGFRGIEGGRNATSPGPMWHIG